MCDSDDMDMCDSGCTDFVCKENPAFKNEPPHQDLYKLFGHDRCVIGYRSDDSIEIYPMVWSYRQAKMIKAMLKVTRNIDAVILSEMS